MKRHVILDFFLVNPNEISKTNHSSFDKCLILKNVQNNFFDEYKKKFYFNFASLKIKIL